jgi:sugar O-acyltransferase (sialic acid O-acetyltransferase NeuD family)
MKKEPIILIGGGGHCISCIDVLKLENVFEIIGILDAPEKIGSSVSEIEVIGTDEDIPKFVKENMHFLITIGQIKSSERRLNIYNKVKELGGKLPVIISPRSYISSTALIEEGTILMHNSLLNSHARIGRGCIINTGALIEHESVIGDFCHISTQAVVNGQVKIGNGSFIGSNAVIANNVTLPDNIIVASGACIHRSVDKTGLYIGNPARKFVKK